MPIIIEIEHTDRDILRLLAEGFNRIERLLETILEKENTMSAEIDRLTASVTALTTVDDSLVTLVGNLAQAIRDNATDPAALNSLADKLDAEASKVSTAVTANTPAAA